MTRCIVCDEPIDDDGEPTYCGSIHPECAEEPVEGDYTTTDHVRWYQHGKLVLTTADPSDAYEQLKAHMDAQRFWAAAWFISDHGNAHLIDLSED